MRNFIISCAMLFTACGSYNAPAQEQTYPQAALDSGATSDAGIPYTIVPSGGDRSACVECETGYRPQTTEPDGICCSERRYVTGTGLCGCEPN